jgi:FKBP-type peptidyl-prolyl cis-trans isomerase 2
LLGHLCSVKYIAYFYDKIIFDSSPKDGSDTTHIVIGDIAWPEGLWRGLQNMRKGESAKIRIKKKFAFGRPGEVDALRFPHGYSTSEADSERRQKITSKAVIYEVTLVDFVVRQDMEANSKYYK